MHMKEISNWQKEVYKKQLAIYEQITILIVKKKHMKPWTNVLAYNNNFFIMKRDHVMYI